MARMETEETTLREWIVQNTGSANCTTLQALMTFSGKWTLRVLFELCRADCLRFGELKRAVPLITNTMLSSTLKDLEASGIINRVQYQEMPLRVEYSLSETGLAILPVVVEIIKWGRTLPGAMADGASQDED